MSKTTKILFALALFSVLSVPALATDPNLMGYWKFDEGTGSTTIDSSGNGNLGTLNNASWNSGKYNNSIDFNGIDSYVDLGNKMNIGLNADIGQGKPSEATIELWIKPNAWNTAGFVYSCDDLCHSGSRWGIAGYHDPLWGNNVEVEMFGYVVNTRDAWNSANYPNNQWTFIVATYDASSVSYYRNGNLIRTTQQYAFNNFHPELNGSSSPVVVGRGGYSSSRTYPFYFSGGIDNVVIYNRTLNSSEILDHYYNQTPDCPEVFVENSTENITVPINETLNITDNTTIENTTSNVTDTSTTVQEDIVITVPDVPVATNGGGGGASFGGISATVSKPEPPAPISDNNYVSPTGDIYAPDNITVVIPDITPPATFGLTTSLESAPIPALLHTAYDFATTNNALMVALLMVI